jgi:iron complex outermembrane recepter protein
MSAAPVGAQTAPAAQSGTAAEPIQLPAVTVTTASPVSKPHKTNKKTTGTGGPVGPSSSAGTAVPAPVIPPLPGTIVADDAFVAVTVATAREIEATAGPTITDTLMNKPGIVGSTFAPGANRPIIRGLDENRIRVQENGISTQDVSAISEDHAFPVDPYAADKVEVVRGPATLRYGSQAIGGVVSVENNRIPSFMPKNGFDAEIRGGITSVDNGRDGAFSTNAGSGNFVFHADAFKRQADDYDTPLGRQSNTFVDTDGVSFGGSFVGHDGYAGVSFTEFNSLYGIPGEDSHIDMQQDKIMSKGEWRVNSNGIEAIRYWFGASDYQHNEVSPEGEIGARFLNKEQEGRIEVEHQAFATAFGELRGAAGIQIDHRKTTGLAFEEEDDGMGGLVKADNLLEPSTTDQVAGFLFEELQASRYLRLQAAGRIENTTVDGLGWTDVSDPDKPVVFQGERDYTPLSASLGALYELPSDIVARVTAAYVERAPAASELFSKGAHDASGTFEIGNPNLGIESAKTVELGFKRAKGDLRFDTSVYYTQFSDFIYRQVTPGVLCGGTLSSCGDPGVDELKQVTFQQRDATFYGAELAAEYDVARVWNGLWGIDGQYDFVHAKFANGEYVPRIPPHRLGGGIYYRDPTWFFRTGLLHAFDQDELGLGETETEGYTLVSAELSYTYRGETHDGITPVTTIGIKGENLADQEVRNHSSFLKDEVLQPGASVRLFGSVKLN